MAQQFGIVIRADGTVPFDAEVSEEHKVAILGHLVNTGHILDKCPVTGHHRIASGPLKPAA